MDTDRTPLSSQPNEDADDDLRTEDGATRQLDKAALLAGAGSDTPQAAPDPDWNEVVNIGKFGGQGAPEENAADAEDTDGIVPPDEPQTRIVR